MATGRHRASVASADKPPGTDASYEDAAPPYDEAPTTINVIITGECQQGKSTLIQQLSRYANAEDLSIGIGDGNKACTMDVSAYDLQIKLRSFQLVDIATGKPIQKSDYSDLVALEQADARVVEVPNPAGAAPTIRFRFVDTPGLNDTHGEDFSIMSRILGRATDLGHVNALIYVRSVENSFGASFKTFFRYIQRSMPSICNGLIVVHSCFKVDRVDEFLADANQRLEDIRRDAFEAATQLELEHFFMDNSPDPASPFAIVQSLNEIHRLLSHLSSQKPLPVRNFKLLKTEAMRHRDILVINALTTLGRRQDKEWNREKGTAEVLRMTAASAEREIGKLRNKIEAKQTHLRALKTKDEILLGKKSCVGHYSFVGDLLFQGSLNLGTKELVYDSDYPITSVTKTCSPGSKWLSEELRGTSWRGEIYGNLFRDINGTATFYTTNELKNQKEIRLLESVVADMQDQLDVKEDALARTAELATGGGGLSGRLAELGDNINRIEALTEMLGQDAFDMTLWPAVRGFYSQQNLPTADEIRNFVKVFDDKVGQLL
ncbi:hypothetical protein B0T22DRAFT_521632 [Podospora appendiculata]|uniref:G domain-containing protein n=1 Tax=Podospora appendiculata TaxID=314037 RepID=A0AAE1C803_9PEZI|nr:hypothetical protein B0T22DRAFT_521632 [Podospora appendiculata]